MMKKIFVWSLSVLVVLVAFAGIVTASAEDGFAIARGDNSDGALDCVAVSAILVESNEETTDEDWYCEETTAENWDYEEKTSGVKITVTLLIILLAIVAVLLGGAFIVAVALSMVALIGIPVMIIAAIIKKTKR